MVFKTNYRLMQVKSVAPKGAFCKTTKTGVKQLLSKRQKNWFSRLFIPKCRSKGLQNAHLEHSAILFDLH